jgi:L-aminopeptidase/D-esterase-like protein
LPPPANLTQAVSGGCGRRTAARYRRSVSAASVPRSPSSGGSLCDVDGVFVGHHQRTGRGWQTGTTVVHVPAGAVSAVDVRGGGPGTRETDALDPGNLVDRVHAICLTGGSAYGLAAADGVVAELERRGLGVPVGPEAHQVVPVVPTAVIFDLGRGGTFANRPTPEFGRRALVAARRTDRRGSVGAGTGARAGGLQGGVGMASASVRIGGDHPVRVAALAVVNASGCVIDPNTAQPWTSHPMLRRPDAADRRVWRAWAAAAIAERESLNTTIGVVVTDAELTRPEARRLAMAAHDGLARSIRPAHGLTDGDAIFALATERQPLPTASDGLVRSHGSRAPHLNALCAAAAAVFAEACTDAVVRASAVGDAPTYLGLCPSARRS